MDWGRKVEMSGELCNKKDSNLKKWISFEMDIHFGWMKVSAAEKVTGAKRHNMPVLLMQ